MTLEQMKFKAVEMFEDMAVSGMNIWIQKCCLVNTSDKSADLEVKGHEVWHRIIKRIVKANDTAFC